MLNDTCDGGKFSQPPTAGPVCDRSNEIWSFGKPAYDAIVVTMRLRQRLRPYIHAQWQEAARSGTPPIRPLFWEFPHDEAVRAVCPVRCARVPHVRACGCGVFDCQTLCACSFESHRCVRDASQAALVTDQMMSGPDYLVAPQFARLNESGTHREVYLPVLPSGDTWLDYWTNTSHGGGQTIDVATPLESFGLFRRLRAGGGRLDLASRETVPTSQI